MPKILHGEISVQFLTLHYPSVRRKYVKSCTFFAVKSVLMYLNLTPFGDEDSRSFLFVFPFFNFLL